MQVKSKLIPKQAEKGNNENQRIWRTENKKSIEKINKSKAGSFKGEKNISIKSITLPQR